MFENYNTLNVEIFMLQKLFAGINLTVGILSVLIGIFFFVVIMANSSGTQSMALVVLFSWVVLCLLTLPLLLHGFLYFKCPVVFEKYNIFISLFIVLEIVAVYIKTQGFYDLFYSNEPYQFNEGVVFTFILSYFILQLFIFPNKLNLMMSKLFCRC